MQSFAKIKEEVDKALKDIKFKIAIMSGKGGVGKSVVTAYLGLVLAKKGYKVGILDVDIHGPSIPKILGLEKRSIYGTEDSKIVPVDGPEGIKVVSMAFVLPQEDTPVIWRGPLKTNVIRQFLTDTLWGSLDYLLIDLPPGTGDEPLTITQFLQKSLTGIIVVTIPSDLSVGIVKKSISFTSQVGVPLVGIVKNMDGLICPNCGTRINIFQGKKVEEFGDKILASIPLDVDLSKAVDEGKPLLNETSEVYKAFENIVKKVEEFVKARQ